MKNIDKRENGIILKCGQKMPEWTYDLLEDKEIEILTSSKFIYFCKYSRNLSDMALDFNDENYGFIDLMEYNFQKIGKDWYIEYTMYAERLKG